MGKTSKLVLMDRMTRFRVVLALFFRMMGWQVKYLTLAPKLNRDGVVDFLSFFDIRMFDWQEQTDVNAYTPYYLAADLADRLLNRLYPDAHLLGKMSGIFPQAPDQIRKIRVILFNRMKSLTFEIAQYLYILDRLERENPGKTMAVSAHPLVHYYLHATGSQICLLYPRYLALLFNGLSIIIKAAQFALVRLISLLRRGLSKPVSQPKEAGKESDPQHFEVVYFPHQGINYSNLFFKDHYYSEDSTSPFHRQNLLHVEIHTASETMLSAIEADYRRLSMNYFFFKFQSKQYIAFFKTYFAFVARNYSSVCRSARRDWPGIIFLSIIYAVVQKYFNLASRFTQAKIALAGYDYMFPPALSLALQARGIKVVAAQERFNQVFFPDSAMIFDVHFSTSRKSAKAISSSGHSAVDSFEPIGLVRGDQIPFRTHAWKGSSGSGSPTIVVYDFHSPDNRIENFQTVLNNWRNNKAFYKEMIQLAIEFPQAKFIIRGKDDAWCQVPCLRDVYDMMQYLPNLEINRDYKTLYESYRLANSADLIIAKYTSICDECLAAGIPVLIHDYAENAKRCVAPLYDYDQAPFFLFSFDDLRTKVRRFLEEGAYLEPRFLEKFREEFFGGPADGQNLKRLKSALQSLYEQSIPSDKSETLNR